MKDNLTNRYVPILKGKLGEFRALLHLTDVTKDSVTPLIEVPPIPWDFEEDEPARKIDKHLEKLIPNISKHWGSERQFYIDFNFIPSEERMNDNSHPIIWVFNQAREAGLSCIPVIGLNRDSDYLEAVKTVVKQDKRGVCIRIENNDIEDDNLDESITQIVKSMGLKEPDVDIVIDLKEIQKEQMGLLIRSIRDVIRSLPNVDNWRALSLVATSFPQTMSGFDPDSVSLTTRVEWNLWTTLFHNLNKIPRMPDYGDYTIVHPELIDVDPRIMQLGAKIKYTCDQEWIIVKGGSIKRRGSEQTRDLCRTLVKLDQYQGKNFSYGDLYIYNCANGLEGVGNQTTWVTVGVNHHIAFVVNQLKKYSVL